MKKPSEQDYPKWLKEHFGCQLDDKASRYYTTTTAGLKDDFCKSDIWNGFKKSLSDAKEAYYLETESFLFDGEAEPEILIKPYDSVVNKSYRKNVLQNSNWPEEPKGGWVTPDNWLEKLNDIFRCTVSTRFVDGVKFLEKANRKHCEKECIEFESDFEARDEGYYACHNYVFFDAEMPDRSWKPIDLRARIEIQVRTQLQELIRTLLHKFYDTNRSSTGDSKDSWKWDYISDEFATNYLGHMLHYIDGQVVKLRDQGEKDVS